MSNSPRLAIPELSESQAGKYLTHNEAIKRLDALVQAVVKGYTATPPVSPAEGDCYLVGASATGAWAGQDQKIAQYYGAAWNFIAPSDGWWVYNTGATPNAFYVYASSAWSQATITNPMTTAQDLIVGGASGVPARLAVGFEGQVLSVVSGAVAWDYPSASSAGARELLTSARSYYVRSDGSDSNDGLTNTSGGAFLTIQKAVDVVSGTLDLATYDVTIYVGTGTWTASTALKPIVGAGTVIIRGITADLSSTVISTTSADCFNGTWSGVYSIQYMKLQTTTSGVCIRVRGGLTYGNVDFGASASAHISSNYGGSHVTAIANYTISGGCTYHIAGLTSTTVLVTGVTITISGTPAFTGAFVWASYCGVIQIYSNTYSGSATGSRYNATLNGVIYTAGATLPGNSAGSTATGGQYA